MPAPAASRCRADDLQARLQIRMEELSQMRRLAPQSPVVIGGALIIPIGLLKRLQGEPSPEETELFGKNRKAVELAAMEAVLTREQNLGYKPVDVSEKNLDGTLCRTYQALENYALLR